MSIKASEIMVLRDHFLYNSKQYKDLRTEIDIALGRAKELLEKEIFKDFSDSEVKALFNISPEFIYSKKLYLGLDFINCFSVKYRRYEYPIVVNYPKNSDFIDKGDYFQSLDSDKIKTKIEKIIPINNEIIKLQFKILDLEENFSRFINEGTSLVWLRKEFPEVYKKLKNGV